VKDVNFPLRKAYITALGDPLEVDVTHPAASTIEVPIYYLVAPDSETGKYYITLNQVANSEAGTFSSDDTNTSMQVQIHPAALPVWIGQQSYAGIDAGTNAAYPSVRLEI